MNKTKTEWAERSTEKDQLNWNYSHSLSLVLWFSLLFSFSLFFAFSKSNSHCVHRENTGEENREFALELSLLWTEPTASLFTTESTVIQQTATVRVKLQPPYQRNRVCRVRACARCRRWRVNWRVWSEMCASVRGRKTIVVHRPKLANDGIPLRWTTAGRISRWVNESHETWKCAPNMSWVKASAPARHRMCPNSTPQGKIGNFSLKVSRWSRILAFSFVTFSLLLFAVTRRRGRCDRSGKKRFRAQFNEFTNERIEIALTSVFPQVWCEVNDNRMHWLYSTISIGWEEIRNSTLTRCLTRIAALLQY